MIRILTILVLIFGGVAAEGEDCDCTIFPFQPNPPCYDKCTANYIAVATGQELKQIGITAEIADKIDSIPRDDLPRQLSGYKEILGSEDFEQLARDIRRLSAREYKTLRESATRRGDDVNDPWDDPWRDELPAVLEKPRTKTVYPPPPKRNGPH